jgi:hypothetical protein
LVLIAGTQQGNSYGFGGDFYGLGLWKMEFLNIPLAKFCWVCFAGKMPTNNVLYKILGVQEDERRARIVDPAETNHGCSRD